MQYKLHHSLPGSLKTVCISGQTLNKVACVKNGEDYFRNLPDSLAANCIAFSGLGGENNNVFGFMVFLSVGKVWRGLKYKPGIDPAYF